MLRRVVDWFINSLAIIWLPVILIVLAGLFWMIFGACTTERCIDSQHFLNQVVQQLNSGK
jgi:hypothetical protein